MSHFKHATFSRMTHFHECHILRMPHFHDCQIFKNATFFTLCLFSSFSLFFHFFLNDLSRQSQMDLARKFLKERALGSGKKEPESGLVKPETDVDDDDQV
jgi:hypothetical protein